MTIPVIDLTDALRPGGARNAEVARQIRAAGEATGFFYVIHHGLDAELLARQFEVAEAVLNLPEADKEAIALKHSKAARGYECIGSQTLDANARPDVKESFYCGIEYPPEHPYVQRGYYSYGANQWPAGLPWVRGQSLAYTEAMCALAQRLMQLMALSLDLPEDYFDHTHGNPMVTLRMIRYPAHPADADERTFGAGAHTDWGAVTLLAQDAWGGLEVQMPDGSWVEATPIEGSLVINLGDMIPRWTNGRYHSNPHRVRNTRSGGAPRYSIPFFYTPDYMARVEAVPGSVPEGTAPRYAPCTVGEHLQEMYRKTYGLQAA
ncbi:isopenicillin N synthase family oxygenase [Verticiella sediminum]|uniref:2-oxoglutarate-dependent ethylene/succinate-forming enzyme n=1 Tax=Verticiella sediminum TaxID=1247510 RepID=A0A556ARZ0_9BURK|nr:2-oxoglutarate and iron-dependent oxygenase domain-containing protein [Verticiella sediminum]TSH95686.1 isopenicillin N synthase family oxygenase [Verticiella sediminum]